MDPTLATAQKAAEGILQSDPVLGGICILLTIALVGLLLWHFKETGRLNGDLVSQERGFRKELMSVTEGLHKSVETLQQAMAFLSARDK